MRAEAGSLGRVGETRTRTFRSVVSYTRTRYLPISLLTCRDALTGAQ